MAEAARMFSLRRLERADNVERQELLTSLAHTRALIQQAYGASTVRRTEISLNPTFLRSMPSSPGTNYLLRRVKELEAQP